MSVVAVMEDNAEERRLVFWCPGCAEFHWFRTRGAAPVWSFNEDFDAPTVRASIRVRAGDTQCCHLFITAGKIEYLGDCTHPLAGKTVAMEEVGW